MSSTEENPYKRRKVQTLPRIDENTKKVLSRSFMVSGKVEIEIQNFSKLGLPKDTMATGWVSIYLGDSLLKDISYLRVTPDENGRFKVKFNKMIIQKDKYLFGNKISFIVGKFHVQHNLKHEDKEKLKSRIIHCIMNVDIPDFDQDDKR